MNITDLVDKYADCLPKRLPKDEAELFDKSIREFELQNNVKVSNKRHFIYLIRNGLTNHPLCPVCSENYLKWNVSKKRYNQTCSTSCSNKLVNRWKNRTDDDIQKTIQRRKNTNKAKYGHTNYLASTHGKQQIYEKMQARGVTNPSQLPQVKRKRQETWLDRYGVSHPSKSDAIKAKIKQTNLSRYGRESFSQCHIPQDTLNLLMNKDWLYTQHVILKKSVPEIAEELSVWDTTVLSYLKKHNIKVIRYFSSVGQKQVIEFLLSLGIENIEINTRKVIYPHEVDIFLPEHRLAIEYNGLFWHSEIYKQSTYHLDKTLACERKGIRLIHIFEDEWEFQNQQCKDTLKHLLGKSEKGTYGRDTYIKEIPWSVAREFLDKYHLLGAGSCGSYRIGAFDKNTNQLIGVMVFGQPNNERSSSEEVELRRFVTNKKNNPGLGSKMFKYAINQQGYNSVIAFVDRRWFTGLVKDHIGFKKVSETRPTVWWTNGKVRYHRRFITKKQLTDYTGDSEKSKRQQLKEFGFVRIFDCGKLKLRWNKN